MCRLIYSFVGSTHCKTWLKIQILNQHQSKLRKTSQIFQIEFFSRKKNLINGNIDFSEDKVNKAMNLVKGVSNQLLKKIPTSEAAVEMVFSRHKLGRSPLRSCLKSDIVDKTLFVRYNIAFLYPGLPFLHFECRNDGYEFGVLFD